MNAFLALNRYVGVLFGIVVATGALYFGLNEYAKARQRIRKEGEAYIQEMISQSQNSLPPGLNGEYPADGPLADFYREHPAIDGSYIPVAPY